MPQPWRNATIIPLLKMGKLASNIESFRPVSLTSCTVKTLERMIVHRLYQFAEARGLFSHTQAGFRKNRSREDRLLRMTQDISDSFEDRKPKRTVMALLDLSRAYDREWKEDLLLFLVDGGVPLKIVRWFHAFLRNRQFKVLLNGSLSRTKWLIHGVPQGAVSSPLLFLFYINTIADNLPDEVRNSIFADDLTIWASNNQKVEACDSIQRAVRTIEEWCRKKKMTMSDKSVVTFFSSGSGDAKWIPRVTMNGLPLKFDPAPKLLGINMSRTLSFQSHVDKVGAKVQKRNSILACLSTLQWGWKKKPLRKIFLATQRSVLDYAAPA